jgi:hypothetical protein
VKAIVSFWGLLIVILLAVRIWVAYKRSPEDMTLTGQVLWKILNVVLIIFGVVVAIVILIVLVQIGSQMIQNFS